MDQPNFVVECLWFTVINTITIYDVVQPNFVVEWVIPDNLQGGHLSHHLRLVEARKGVFGDCKVGEVSDDDCDEGKEDDDDCDVGKEDDDDCDIGEVDDDDDDVGEEVDWKLNLWRMKGLKVSLPTSGFNDSYRCKNHIVDKKMADVY